MLRQLSKIAAGFLCGVFAITLGVSALLADEKKPGKKLSVHDIMEKVPGKKGLCATTVAKAKAEDWDAASKLAKELKVYGDALPEAEKPEKGTKESWTKLSKEFAVNMSTIAAGVEKKDIKTVNEGVKAFGASCKECHDNHKE